MKAALPPSLAMAQATLAGAPPGALRKPRDSAKDTPDVSGTKSISISPNDITKEPLEPDIFFFFFSLRVPVVILDFLCLTYVENLI